MSRRYRLNYKICNTEAEAKAICDSENKNYYKRKHHPAHYTPWSSSDGSETGFVAWYWEK